MLQIQKDPVPGGFHRMVFKSRGFHQAIVDLELRSLFGVPNSLELTAMMWLAREGGDHRFDGQDPSKGRAIFNIQVKTGRN